MPPTCFPSPPRLAAVVALAAVATFAAPLAPAALHAQGAVRGTVYDSLAGRPLAGATVQLVHPDAPAQGRSAVTDAAGAFRVDGLAPGRWVAAFVHPRLDSLGLEMPPRAVDVGAGEATLALAVLSPATIAARTCALPPGDSTGLLLARVRDADTDLPLAGSTVQVSWMELVVDGDGLRSLRRGTDAVTDETGRVALCGIPTDVPVIAVAELGEAASGPVELQVPARGLRHRDLRVGRGAAAALAAAAEAPASDDSAAARFQPRRGSARLVGTVVNADGSPMSGARVVVHGATATATTGSDGTFTLEALPAGTQTVEARAIGWLPQRRAVDLASARTDTVRVTLGERVQALERVTVYGRERAREDFYGVLRRQQKGMGRYLTQAQIERRAAFDVTDLVRDMPSVRIVTGESMFDRVILLRNCAPTVYLDGRELIGGAQFISEIVRPEELAAVEIYNSPVTAPAELLPNPRNMRCGVAAFWTKWRLES